MYKISFTCDNIEQAKRLRKIIIEFFDNDNKQED